MKNILLKLICSVKKMALTLTMSIRNKTNRYWMIGVVAMSLLFLSAPHEAKALPSLNPFDYIFSSDTVYSVVTKALSYLGNGIMMLASAYLRICGVLLNASVNLTMNISWFVNNNDSIKFAWTAIRDFSSIFFIGILLYASITLIIGVAGPGVKKTIFNIVMAGLLVNFSLFITKTLIDVSNVVTLSIYRAIAPGEVVDFNKISQPGNTAQTNGVTLNQQQQSLISDNGIANVFMGLLRIQTIYDPAGSIGDTKSATANNRGSVALKIITASAMGTAIMIIAGTNFAIIALVFLARFAILILLLIFSPIAFLGNIIPQTKEYSDKWWKELQSQLIFPPIYFIMIYVALRIMTDPRFQSLTGGTTKNATFAAVFSGTGPIGIVIQYSIVIVLIIKALTVALKTSGTASEWTDKHIKKYTGAFMANTVGKAAMAVRGTNAFKAVATSKFVPQFVGKSINKGLKATADAKFGSDKSYTTRVKDYSKDAVSYAKDMKASSDKKMGEYDNEYRSRINAIELAKANLVTGVQNNPTILSAKAKTAKSKTNFEEAKAEAARAIGSSNAAALASIAKAKEVQYNANNNELTRLSTEAHKAGEANIAKLQADLQEKYGKNKEERDALRSKEKNDAEKKYQRKVLDKEKTLFAPKKGWASKLLNSTKSSTAARDIKGEIDKGKAEQEVDTIKNLLESLKPKT